LSEEYYDLVIAGTGFAGSFFLHKILQQNRIKKILVLERGEHYSHAWQLEHKKNSEIDSNDLYRTRGEDNKNWKFTVGFGGSSSCWYACTPRMLPNDFKLKSVYGQGRDWPISYDELEHYYAEVEAIMQISGPSDWSLSHRSTPYPQPPHKFNDIDRHLKAAYPQTYYEQPTARARIPTENRSSCCAAATCNLCPASAKFKIDNEMQHIYEDPRVTLQLGCEVISLDLANNAAKSLKYKDRDGKERVVKADLFALATNAIFNPAILLRSEDRNPFVGRYLHEQLGVKALVDLKGVKNLSGSTIITGLGFMFYDGAHRSSHGACMIESSNNIKSFRLDYKRWTERTSFSFIFEDIPSYDNRITLDIDDKPVATYVNYSKYGLDGLKKIPAYLDEMGKFLPIEKIIYEDAYTNFGLPRSTEAHIMGTATMGNSAEDSVVDRNLVHHQYRNLFVLGGSSFPTGAPANPTLTISALSLRSAETLS